MNSYMAKVKFLDEKPTVKFLDEKPTQATVGGFANQAAIGFGNEFALGLPLFALEKMKGIEARKSLESNNPIERIGRGIGTTVGMATVLRAFLNHNVLPSSSVLYWSNKNPLKNEVPSN